MKFSDDVVERNGSKFVRVLDLAFLFPCSPFAEEVRQCFQGREGAGSRTFPLYLI